MKTKQILSALEIFLSRYTTLTLCCVVLTFAVSRSVSGAEGEVAKKRIVVLGDSIAAGYGIGPEQAFPAILQEKVDEMKLNYEVVNAGVSGDTTAGGLRRTNWLLQRPVDALVIELGGNDALRGIDPETTKANLKGIIDATKKKYPDAKIVIAGMQIHQNMGNEYTEQFKNLFPEIAKETGSHLVPFLLEGVGGVPELNQADQIHPNPEGHRIVADNVWEVLEEVLGEAD